MEYVLCILRGPCSRLHILHNKEYPSTLKLHGTELSVLSRELNLSGGYLHYLHRFVVVDKVTSVPVTVYPVLFFTKIVSSMIRGGRKQFRTIKNTNSCFLGQTKMSG